MMYTFISPVILAYTTLTTEKRCAWMALRRTSFFTSVNNAALDSKIDGISRLLLNSRNLIFVKILKAGYQTFFSSEKKAKASLPRLHNNNK